MKREGKPFLILECVSLNSKEKKKKESVTDK